MTEKGRRNRTTRRRTSTQNPGAGGERAPAAGEETVRKILVTGAFGFSGSHMLRLLVEEGYRNIRATDLESTSANPKARWLHRELGVDLERDGIEFVPADLTDKESLRAALEGVEILFHPASLYDYSAPPEALERVNVLGVTNLCEIAVDAGVRRMLHWSTAGVYGHPYMPGERSNPLWPLYEFFWGILVRPWLADSGYLRPRDYPTNQPFTEDSPNPLNTNGPGPEGTYLVNDYSVSKWKQEQTLQRFLREKNLPVTIIRPAPLYGPGSDYGIGGIVVAISEGLIPRVPADLGNYLMVNCHVRDACRAALFLARRPETIGEVFNVVDDSLVSQLDFLRRAALLTGRNLGLLDLLTVPIFAPLAVSSARVVAWLDKTFPRYKRYRIWEESSARYISSSYWISNRKLKNLGFRWEYPDFAVGLKETVEWLVKAELIK